MTSPFTPEQEAYLRAIIRDEVTRLIGPGMTTEEVVEMASQMAVFVMKAATDRARP